MRAIVKKLPYQLHDKWRAVVQGLYDKGETVRFEHLVKFINTEARKGRDAVYGRDMLRVESSKKPPTKKSFATTKKKKTTSCATTDNTQSKGQSQTQSNSQGDTPYIRECILCKEDHSLSRCEQFDKLSNDDKVKYIIDNKLCFGCLKGNHMKNKCKRKLICEICKKQHPTVLHQENFVYKRFDSEGESELSTPVTNATVIDISATGAGKDCSMPIIPVQVRVKNKVSCINTYAFLDSGSSVSFCSDALAQTLGFSGKGVKLTIETMGNTHTMHSKVIKNLVVSDTTGGQSIELPDIYTKEKMPVDHSHIPTRESLQQWSHLRNLNIPDLDCDVGLLIGNNVPSAWAPIEIKCGPTGSPFATRSILGWIPWGVERSDSGTPTVNRAEVIAISERTELDRMVRDAINRDFPERVIDDKREMSQEDIQFTKQIDKSLELKDGHYYMTLPFRNEIVMPDNKTQVARRLQTLERKFKHDNSYKEEYTTFVTSLLDKGYAEPVPDEKLNRSDGHVWYIPHHGVYHPTKKKLRVVFDCAAQYDGVSLNGNLLQGPNYTNSLIGVLLRFRENPIAVQGDIEAMFHQVRVPENDRDYLRFLWWPDGDTEQPPKEYRMCVHLFGATSSPTCANVGLRKTAEAGTENFDNSVTECVLNNFYVDDYLKSLPSVAKAIENIEQVSQLCSKGGFNLTKWASNSRDVMSTVPLEKRAKSFKELNLDKDILPKERALGVGWDTDRDVFYFNVSLKSKPPTRRNVLSIASSVYDPLGFIAPCVLTSKLILRELCGQDWDDKLENNLLHKWQTWLDELPLLQDVFVPRCVIPPNFGEVIERQLHHFCDASEVGYGVASYLRLVSKGGQIHCCLVMAKSRVAPLKKISIPRMELTAAKLAVQLNKIIVDQLEHPVDEVFFWTDSTSVLKYIHNTKTRFHTFVANRIALIREATTVNQWQYISSIDNPADIASRGVSPRELVNSNWFSGPPFLYKEWSPRILDNLNMDLDPNDTEVKKLVFTATVINKVEDMLQRYSNYNKTKAVFACVLIYVSNLAKWVKRRKQMRIALQSRFPDDDIREQAIDFGIRKEKLSEHSTKQVVLTVEDLEKAESVFVKNAQSLFLQEELSRLKGGNPVQGTGDIKRLDPFIDNGIIRVGGRLSRAALSKDTKHPIIVPKQSRLAELLIYNAHRELGHLGKNAIVSHLRTKYWVVSVNVLIKRVVTRCVICKKYQARLMGQKMADLPAYRLETNVPPFTNVGMDYFGPFEIKRGRSLVKRYGVLFTCLNTRAVHLEVADSLDTDSCINAIRRFKARRGDIRYIRSDNGTNLVSANTELRENLQRLNSAKLQHVCAQRGIKWEFNPPSGSHFGGVWERLIRSVRKILYGLLKEQTIRLNDDGLCTVFCEVEAILNNRPLVEMSNSVNDLQVLTPNHLLLFRATENAPPGLFNVKDSYVKRRWRQIQYIADVFWKRFVKEYMVTLQERQKWLKRQRNVTVGDIVLVVDNTPRNTWCLARVLEVNPDKHGLVRFVKVKTANSELIRPVDKLCLVLEGNE